MPCIDPTEPCQIVVKPAPAPKAASKPVAPVAPAVQAKPAPGHKQAKPAQPATQPATQPAVQPAPNTRPGKWVPILYVVRINKRIAKYAGYVCK